MAMPTEAVPQDPERSVELLRLAQAGDDEARNDLLARYLPRLERWASRRLPRGVRTMLDTGDLVQDAVINALRHLDTIEIRTDFQHIGILSLEFHVDKLSRPLL